MEVEVISRETIKPSSPTPPHLRTYRISLLDQLLPTIHTPFALYYHPTNKSINGGIEDSYMINQRLPQLRDSLSETLTRFYPLAGKVKNHYSIDCNDDGVPFTVARVRNCQMTEVLSEQTRIDRLLPRQLGLTTIGEIGDVQVAIQLNVFDNGGGVAIGLNFLHRIIDGATICAFLKCWATIAGGGIAICWPDYSAASLYPPREAGPDNLSSAYFVPRLFFKEGKVSSRRFVFDSAAITTLKTRAKSTLLPDPTRIEVLSCFIWKHAMAASRVVTGTPQPSALACPVNLRRVISPPVPEYAVGNFLWNAIAFCDEVASEEMELHGLVGLLRAAIKRVKSDFVPKSTQGVGGYEAICKYAEEQHETCSSTKNLSLYMFNSWCRMGFYDVDFGWGNPACITARRAISDSKIKNAIFFIESGNCDDKIEAWIVLDLHQMAILENDPEFLEFASSILTPAPSAT